MPDTAPLYIVTGASRGLGAAIAEQLLEPGATLICISRGNHPTLEREARKCGASVSQWTGDLSDPGPVATRLRDWLNTEPANRYTSAALINNAGAISRIGPVEACPFDELSRALRVGLEAPLLLSAAFLEATRHWASSRKILNISSGLGRYAIAGAASYCAAKAGLDNLSRAMALDEAAHANGARIVALAPGVIDTDMQQQLRNAPADGFPNRSYFVGLKEQGQLESAKAAARKVIEFLRRPDFGSDVLADVRSV